MVYMPRATTIFTTDRVGYHGITVVFNDMRSQRTTRAAVLLRMNFECLSKSSGEVAERIFRGGALGNRLVGLCFIKNGIPEESNLLRFGYEVFRTLRG